MGTVLALCLDGDSEVEHKAVTAVANLMEMVELHEFLMKADGLGPLVALLLSDDILTKGEACRALANLSANDDIRDPIMKEVALSTRLLTPPAARHQLTPLPHSLLPSGWPVTACGRTGHTQPSVPSLRCPHHCQPGHRREQPDHYCTGGCRRCAGIASQEPSSAH